MKNPEYFEVHMKNPWTFWSSYEEHKNIMKFKLMNLWTFWNSECIPKTLCKSC